MILQLLLLVLEDLAFALGWTLIVLFAVGVVVMVWLSCWVIYLNVTRARAGEGGTLVVLPPRGTVDPEFVLRVSDELHGRAVEKGGLS